MQFGFAAEVASLFEEKRAPCSSSWADSLSSDGWKMWPLLMGRGIRGDHLAEALTGLKAGDSEEAELASVEPSLPVYALWCAEKSVGGGGIESPGLVSLSLRPFLWPGSFFFFFFFFKQAAGSPRPWKPDRPLRALST